MKQYLKYLPFLIGLVLVLSSCGPANKLRRAERLISAAEAQGAKWSVDTVFKEIKVITPKIEFDTVLRQVNFTDTITVEKDKVITRFKINTLTKEIFVHTECPPDTIRVEVPVTVTKEIKAGATTWDIIILGIAIAVVFFIIGYVVRMIKNR